MSNNAHTSPNAWLSPRRHTIAALRARLALLPLPDYDKHDAARARLEATLRGLKDEMREIRVAAMYDSGLLTVIGRKARSRSREKVLDQIRVELDRCCADLCAEQERYELEWTQWCDGDTAITREVELAAAEEFELRHHGRRAPWLELTLGPIPPVDRRELARRWFAVAEYITHLRVKRDVTDPTSSGLTPDDSMLVGDIRKLRWHTKQAIGHTPLARRFDPMEGAYRPGRIGLPGIPPGHRE